VTSAVRIERLDVVPYALPFKEPYVTARGRLDRRELLLLRLHAEGLEGLGEAAPLALRGGTTLATIAGELDGPCRSLLEDATLERPEDWSLLAARCEALGISRQTLAGVELALLDLAGKLAKVPAHRLLGATAARAIECNATLVAGKPHQVAIAAEEWAARGFKTFKLKVGVADDVEQVAAVRTALGREARLRVDANGIWILGTAAARLAEMHERSGLELAEQPVASLDDMARLRDVVAVAIAADESVTAPGDGREAALRGSCDAATVKLAKVGGVRASFELASEIPVYLSSALDGPIGIAGAAHVAQALPHSGFAADLAQGLATAELFEATIASAECHMEGAALVLPDGPGLGVELDGPALERHRIELG
jgi:o-succinylbenzoate synthase